MADWNWFGDVRVELVDGVIYEKFPDTPPAPRRWNWTKDQYHRMAEAGFFDGYRVELVAGEIFQMAPISGPHASSTLLAQHVLQQAFGDGYIVRPQMPLELDNGSEPEPDIAVVQGSIRDFIGSHPSTAALLVEISRSTLLYDRKEKAELYARAGIPEYWIVNLKARQLEVFRAPQNGKYGDKKIIAADASIAPLAAPDAQIAVADLLP